MSQIFLPPNVAREMHDAEVRSQMREDLGAMRYWNPKLQQIDEFLQLVRIAENATTDGLTPGYWHVFRMKPGVPATNVLTVEFPDGSYREPDSWMVNMLESKDWQNPRVWQARLRAEKQKQRDKEHARYEERGEMVEEIAGLLKGRNNPGVNFGAKKWARNPTERHK